jgi:hypothetical protein
VIGSLEAITLDWLEHQDMDLAEVAELLHRLVWGGLSGFDRDRITFPDESILALPT